MGIGFQHKNYSNNRIKKENAELLKNFRAEWDCVLKWLKSGITSTYIHFAYTSLENRKERLILSLFPKFQRAQGDDELLEDTMKRLGAELGFDVPKSSEITYYRRLRNKIVHHAKDVDFEDGKNAQLFFESLLEEIDCAIENNKNKTIGGTD